MTLIENAYPLTTPMAKLMPNMAAQKRTARLYCSFPVRSACVLKIRIRSAVPMVSCGKMQWDLAVKRELQPVNIDC